MSDKMEPQVGETRLPARRRNRPRSLVDSIAEIESADPRLVASMGLSTAALRAGELIRSMRKNARYSQTELAQKIAVSQARISELEAGLGTQGPTFEVMERIAWACGTSIDPSLFGFDTKDNTDKSVVEVFEELNAQGISEQVMRVSEINGQKYLIFDIPVAGDEVDAEIKVKQIVMGAAKLTA